ncbi:MAG TPA: histidine phosphatase family protein [Candidatus Peribacteraceae bacterium]|nr:histidine phosphatase family protein [Candidatus Peribacteraceae bacterium]
MSLANESLENTYYALRHGHSIPNEQKLIVSHPEEGEKEQYGLTQKGRDQVTQSIRDALQLKVFGDMRIVLVSSPFKRAAETTNITYRSIESAQDTPPHALVRNALRERYFGDFDGGLSDNYERVWALDALDPEHTSHNVESVVSVLQRQEQLLQMLEDTYCDACIILSGHGDPLQILETSFRGMDPSQHRELPPLQNAELRKLNK